jgi:hypothetical protein
MATTINKPFLTSSFSAQGSAEVLGRGSNDYTDIWSHDLTEFDDWDKFSNFPTAVRTGNFVWVLYSVASDRVIWMLTDLVPDVPNQFGNNIAYPVLANYVKYEFDYTSNATAYKASDGTLTDDTSRDGTPLYALTTTILFTATANGKTQSYFESGKTYKEIVYNGTDTGGFITANNADVPWLYGWGSAQTLLQDDNSERTGHLYGLFAPFATKAQFETLYGTEAEWIHSTLDTSNHVLFDQVYSGTNTVAYSGDDPTLTYPFTTPTFTANTLYKDIPGDTDQDGIDDTPTLEDALAVYAVTTAALPNLDITKCKFDAKIKLPIPGLDEFSINEQVNKVKAAVTSAISSTGLLEIGKTAEGLKARLKSLLPELPQFPNLADELSKLDPSNSDAVQSIKKRWGNVVDNIESVIDDIQNLDICTLVDKKAIVGEDGELSAKAEMPIEPEGDVIESPLSAYVPTRGAGLPIDDIQAATGHTQSYAEESIEVYRTAWKDMVASLDSSLGIVATDVIRSFEEQLEALEQHPEYKAGRDVANRKGSIMEITQAINNYSGEPLGTAAFIYEQENIFYDELHRLRWYQSALAAAQKQISDKLLTKADHGITPDSDPSTLWNPPGRGINNAVVSKEFKYPGALFATYGPDTDAEITKLYNNINKHIKDFILKEDVIQSARVVVNGRPWDYKVNTTSLATVNSDTLDGDSIELYIPIMAGEFGSEGEAGTEGTANAGTVSYIKGYKYKQRHYPIQPALMKILEKVAEETGWNIIIFSGGQLSRAELTLKGIPRSQWTKYRTASGTKRHDDGFAADIEIRTQDGHRFSVENATKDGRERQSIIKAIDVLMKHGITSIGGDDRNYQNGNLHVDICDASIADPTVWGYPSGGGNGRKNAPDWLRDAYDKANLKYNNVPIPKE